MVEHLVVTSFFCQGRSYRIRFMRYRRHFPAQEYILEMEEKLRGPLLGALRHFADHGRLPSVTRGRWLQGNYSTLYEFKAQRHRILGFLDGNGMILTNGASKKNVRAQRQDYDLALAMKADYFGDRQHDRHQH